MKRAFPYVFFCLLVFLDFFSQTTTKHTVVGIMQSITASIAEIVIPAMAPSESRVLPPAPLTGAVVRGGGQGVDSSKRRIISTVVKVSLLTAAIDN